MRRVLALLVLGLLAASPSWSSLVGPCPPGTTIPVSVQVAPPICPGQPVNLIARACGPCVDIQYSTQPPSGPLRIVAARDYLACVPTVCVPESLVVPLGTFVGGHYTVLVEVFMYDLVHDSTTCTVSRLDTIRFDVPLACAPPRPLRYTDVIRVGPPPECATCPPPPICPGLEIPFFIAGTLPNNCYQFRGLELLPSPLMSPLPEPPIARVTIMRYDCLRSTCDTVPIPWQAGAMLPGLPGRDYNLIVQLAEISACDSTHGPDTTYSTVVPFQVAERCSVTSSPSCFLHSWGNDSANPDCDAYVGAGTPAREVLRIWTGTPLAGFQGRVQLDPAALRVVGLRPVGIASGMQLAWSERADGASFVLFSTDGHVIRSACEPPAMCPPAAEAVLEVLVAQRPGVPIPPLTLLDVRDLLAADTLGQEVLGCPTAVVIPPARICAGHSCDFNGDGRLDVRDLVLMARCVTGHGNCPDSSTATFDCNKDGSLTVDDVLCCAHVILHGRLPDSLVTRSAPGLTVDVGAPVATESGLDVPIRLTGADQVGAARFALSYPAARYDHASVEMLGDAASWLEVSEAADGEMIIGLIATAPAAQVPGLLEMRVHFGLAPGQTASPDVRVTQSEFVAPDGAVLELASPPTDTPTPAVQFALSPARPNPFVGSTQFVLSLAQAADADLAIFDLAGRRVVTLHRGPLSAGDHPFGWDGRRADGTPAPGGVYFYRVLGAGASATRRLVLLGAR